jgi:L-threonylcarbamoyladenylate synthase
VVSILPLDEKGVHQASKVILNGGIVGFPTDTVYGLGCDPESRAAVESLFRIKAREKKPVPVLCASLNRASVLVEFGELALKLAVRYWPGPLTLVLPLKANLPNQLHQGTGWLGVRVPNHPGCLDLIRSVGGWITGTSANLSGKPASRSAEEVARNLGDRIDVVLDGGPLEGAESTVIKVGADDVEVLRRGAIRLELGAL